MTLDAIMALSPMIAVVTIRDARHAAPLTAALVAGGVPAVEITLRTSSALEAIRAAATVPGAVIGAGTCLNRAQIDAAAEAGAAFAVSPGATSTLLRAAKGAAIPLLPGITTASELMAALEHGYDRLKFFPAESAGGAAAIKALGAPFAKVRFCPTGGITLQNAPSYLVLGNVDCVGGSWLAPEDAIQAADWGRIETLARAAVAALAK
ncbi:KHG/KDPG aldolase [Alphaproteobacteria bacterium SO-S41]|nr:KHG/KDPG aldolase [Alphaproteobacteria bacterium SO-S41]